MLAVYTLVPSALSCNGMLWFLFRLPRISSRSWSSGREIGMPSKSTALTLTVNFSPASIGSAGPTGVPDDRVIVTCVSFT
jgi:hypothetical protein